MNFREVSEDDILKEWLEFRLIPSNDEWKLYFKGSTLQNN